MSLFFSIGNPFIELPQVESTNNYATGMVHAGMAQSGTAVFAHHQTKGKGQHQRQWLDAGGKNIALSVILQPPGLAVAQAFLVSIATAVATHRFFARYAGSETKVKWPNDLYWRDRKAGGILIENSIQGNYWKAAVVGIGININQTHFDTLGKKAVSLKQITGKEHNPLLLAKELCEVLSQTYAEVNSEPFTVIDYYRFHLYKRNEIVRLKQGNRVFTATIKDVSLQGQLIVHGTTEESFNVGDIEWVLQE